LAIFAFIIVLLNPDGYVIIFGKTWIATPLLSIEPGLPRHSAPLHDSPRQKHRLNL